ncbi:hypothetical protein WJX72_005799 [[Myrmecia] bisecta]|uniref:Radial spoke protein 3 n=1 Tax=[Myrmecia] bisecta TaxID=41462 RepID=A0AAW1Q3Q7_9CHLO
MYTHSAEPKAVTQRKAKYRDQEELMYPSNLMFDRRVVRGNTYASQVLPAEPPALPLNTSTKQPTKQSVRPAPAPRTPEPVAGRKHMDIQTDSYLEELTDVVAEAEISTQTDAFMDRPPTPLYIPKKTGVDANTQIDDGDLFDFDFEVEPLLEVLVGKTLEQGLLEVMEEEELAAMRAHQAHFEQVRNAELAAVQRMEAAERRKMEEKERRLEQARRRAAAERDLREKVAANSFARGYLRGLMGTVFGRLYDSGFFYDPVQREVETEFLPWLKAEALQALDSLAQARAVFASVVGDALRYGEQQRQQAEQARRDQDAAAAAEAERAAQAQQAADSRELAEFCALATPLLDALKAEVLSEDKIAEVKASLQAAATPPSRTASAAPGEPAADDAAPAEAPAESTPAAAAKPVSDADVLTALLERKLVVREAVRKLFAALPQPGAAAEVPSSE